MQSLIITVGGFLVLVALLVLLRSKTGGRFEVKTSDVALALTPVALWLFLTGRVKELAFGDVKLVSAIEGAAGAPVAANVTKLPVETIRLGMKGSVGNIGELVAGRVQALGFQLGYGGYYGPAIREYLDALQQNPSFRYVVIQDRDGKLTGLADGRQTAALTRSGRLDPQQLANWLNEGRLDQVQSLPGFIPAAEALHADAETRTALESMNRLDVQALPVVDAEGRLTGVVDRSKLSASMLIEIAQRVGLTK